MRILVTEDEYICRHALTSLLQKHGEVDVAVNGSESLAAVKTAIEEKEPYRLIFMDILMPGMDGLEATKMIRELEKKHGVAPKEEASIIMTTAKCDAKTVVQAFRNHATDYLPKPWDASSVREMLARVEGAR